MSAPQHTAAARGQRPAPEHWVVSMATFAGVIMIITGLFNGIEGLVALFRNVAVDPNDPTKGRRFEDATAAAGLDRGVTWATSAAFADLEGDGYPDLYVRQYVDWSWAKHMPCNYDGKKKNLTTIEDGAFIGSDSQLVAPVTVGKGAYVGSGSTVRENVPAGALAVSAGKQRNIDGWVEKKKKKREIGK